MTVPNPRDDVSDRDREWFGKHRGAVTRWRPFISGEAGPVAEQALRVRAADVERDRLEAGLVVKVTRFVVGLPRPSLRGADASSRRVGGAVVMLLNPREEPPLIRHSWTAVF